MVCAMWAMWTMGTDGRMPFDYSDTTPIKMMMDIARGMEDLHSCGLIHRDLKDFKCPGYAFAAFELTSWRSNWIGGNFGVIVFLPQD
ncbi:unnamed protein product [Sphagnum troendelagicum]|uniref:Protein kinase domain-containing protein n=1 Tax=Sphagnum troendelagicum TaxID=128251 RepID=A0ABP0TPM9_9BRYO